jgi:hypothetical protein
MAGYRHLPPHQNRASIYHYPLANHQVGYPPTHATHVPMNLHNGHTHQMQQHHQQQQQHQLQQHQQLNHHHHIMTRHYLGQHQQQQQQQQQQHQQTITRLHGINMTSNIPLNASKSKFFFIYFPFF